MTDRDPPAPHPPPPLGDPPAPAPSPDDPSAPVCGNCGTALLGPHCYRCGQPVTGLVRHFSSLMGDFLDSVLQWDGRLPRTVGPLFARPGYLTSEYFAGRRVRFVSPVRLFFTISIVTFFFAQLVVSFGDDPIKFDSDGNGFDKATTVDEVIRERDQALQDIAQTRKDGNADIPGVDTGLRAAEGAIRRSAAARIRTLQTADPSEAGAPPSDRSGESAAERADAAAAQASNASGTAAKAASTDDDARSAGRSDAGQSAEAAPTAAAKTTDGDTPAAPGGDNDDINLFDIGGKGWDPTTNPIAIQSLPTWANDGLNSVAARTKKNLERMRQNPDDLKDALLGAVPSTLFILLPVFALLLKLFYVFKRRLYMEHLIVALHSHAFLCLALLLMFVAMALRDAIAAQAGFWYGLLGWCEAALWVWMPLYLLLMQKRVYGQGWWMTLLKYAVLGQFYLFLLSFGAVFTVMFSVIWG